MSVDRILRRSSETPSDKGCFIRHSFLQCAFDLLCLGLLGEKANSSQEGTTLWRGLRSLKDVKRVGESVWPRPPFDEREASLARFSGRDNALCSPAPSSFASQTP